MTQNLRGAIAAGDPKTAEAGKIMFELGGNAFDAAVAAILASFVIEPTLTSAGGGGFLLAHTQDKRNILFDFFTQTPRQKRALCEIDFRPVDVNFGDATQAFHIGLGSIAVPGNLAGIFAVHQKLGKLPFQEIVQPAIHYAENGVDLSSFQDFCINQLLHPILLAMPESRAIYAPQGKLLREGERFYMKEFAETLRAIARRGVREFYQGEIAHQFARDCQEKGGFLTLEDLTQYRVIERKPLRMKYRDREILTNPPPSSGGILIAFALELLSTIDLSKIEFGSPQHRQLLVQVMSLTNCAREDGYDSNLYDNNIIDRFLSEEHLKPYQNSLKNTINKWGSTTHISTIDCEGNAASVTTSNGEGSSYVIPGTNIMLNNMLGEEDLNPLGFHQWARDRRISSMMSPTIILQDGKPIFVLGSGGSNRIRTAILQVISNLIDFRFPLDRAVESPRIHWENNLLNIEPPYSPENIDLNELPKDTEVLFWQAKNMFFGGVHAVGQTPEGVIIGSGDSRRGGACC